MRIVLWTAAVAAMMSVLYAGDLSAQGNYRRAAGRNPIAGRQPFVDPHRPGWTGSGGGGRMFNSGGSLRFAGVRRSLFTGRLEYYSQYINPWTGAQYTTGTQFNPFFGRYETQRRFVPPPPPQSGNPSSEAPAVVEEEVTIPRRGIRVIETKPQTEAAPPDVAPATEAVEPDGKAADPPADSPEPDGQASLFGRAPASIRIRTR